MALEEFLLDLCEESVTAALLVSFLLTHAYLGRPNPQQLLTCATDLLALPDVPPRPRRDTPNRSIPDLSKSIQQGAAHCIRRFGRWPPRENKGKRLAGQRPLQLRSRQRGLAHDTQMGRPTGGCASAEASPRKRARRRYSSG